MHLAWKHVLNIWFLSRRGNLKIFQRNKEIQKDNAYHIVNVDKVLLNWILPNVCWWLLLLAWETRFFFKQPTQEWVTDKSEWESGEFESEWESSEFESLLYF